LPPVLDAAASCVVTSSVVTVGPSPADAADAVVVTAPVVTASVASVLATPVIPVTSLLPAPPKQPEPASRTVTRAARIIGAG